MLRSQLSLCVVGIALLMCTAAAFADGVQRTERTVDRTVHPLYTYGPELDGPLSALSESFEGTTFPPAGWLKISPDGGSGWNRQLNGTTPVPGWTGGRITVPPGGGNAVAFCTWNTGGSSSNNQWLVTPRITNVGPNDSLKFWVRYWPNSYADTVEIRISTTGTNVGDFTTLVAVLAFPRTPDTNWTQYRYRLASFVPVGSNIYIAFREKVADNINEGASISLDLVEVTAPAAGGCTTISSQWCPTGRYPDVPAATYFQAAAWLNDTLFVQAPTSTGAAATTIYKYVPGTGWSTGVPLPAAKVGGTLTKAAGKLYYIGGGSSAITTGTTDVYEFDPATGVWSTKAPLPVALSAHGAVSWGDSIIFVIGGPYTGSATNLNVHYYRIASNTWGTITNSLPTGQGRRTFAYGISGNKIVISSGFNTTFLKSTFVGTIDSTTSIRWTAAPDVPTVYTGLSRPGGTAYGDKFFIVCGERGGPGGYYDTTHVFSISSNAWVGLINNKPFKMSNIFNAVTARCVNDTIRLYVPGGFGSVTGATPGAASAVFDVIACGPGLVSVPEQLSNVPSDFRVEQNYPNPFNPSTTIKFSIPTNTRLSLKVYNMLGQEVATLADGEFGAGTYSVQWNATGFASGVYFYRLQAGNRAETKKLMLLK